MAKKLTNTEALAQIAEMSATEAATYGATPDLQQTAAMAAAGDGPATLSLTATDTPIYNAMLGLLVKLAYTPLRHADYKDLYALHHRNFAQGVPERNFIGLAKAGTGNNAQMESDNDAGNGSLTTVVTAETPDVYSVTVADHGHFVARIPISDADYRNAFNTEYGITDFIGGLRRTLENKIINDRNDLFDRAFGYAAENAVHIGGGSPTQEHMFKATIAAVEELAFSVQDLATTEGLMKSIYQVLSQVYFEMTGRPNEKYNALGVPNNTPADAMVVYVDPKYYAAMRTFVESFAFNSDALTIDPMRIRPMAAPWMGKNVNAGGVGGTVIAAIGSVDWALDYPVNDFAKVIPTDRGEIVTRYLDTELSVAGFEQMCFIVIDM